jgi:hypothetical protein
MSPYLDLALATLEDLRDDLHSKSNKAFYDSRFTTSKKFAQQEASASICITILRSLC